jgi:hypothetical protein
VWKPEWTRYIDGLDVYIWQEPDASGAKFAESIGETLPEAQVLVPPDGRKDISECHSLGDDVPALVQDLVAHATPYKAIQAEAQHRAAAEAEEKAAELLSCPDILSTFGDLCQELGLVGEEHNAKVMFLVVISRLLDRPISACIKGPSSGGKSFIVKTVLTAFPESAFYALSSMSERALAYSKEPLRHRMLVIYEASGLSSDFGTYLMRTLLSEGHIRYETVEKTKDGLVPRLIERDGPTGLILTTTWTNLHPENETRMLSLTIRDDPTQTKAIMHALA